MVKWKKSPACGGNGTIHRGCIIGDAHDTIPPRRVRIHTTTLTYSHQIRHSTRIFAHEHPRAAQRHAPDALSGLGTARDHPRTGPDRPGAGPKLPGAPDTTARTWAARAAQTNTWACPRTAPRARARPPRRPAPAPPALRARPQHRRVRRRSPWPLLRPCRPPRAVVPALERREQRVRVA